jgi:hypothetical protein
VHERCRLSYRSSSSFATPPTTMMIATPRKDHDIFRRTSLIVGPTTLSHRRGEKPRLKVRDDDDDRRWRR